MEMLCDLFYLHLTALVGKAFFLFCLSVFRSFSDYHKWSKYKAMYFMKTKEKDLETTTTSEEETDSSDEVSFIYHFLKCCQNSRCLLSDQLKYVYYLIMNHLPNLRLYTVA